MPFESHKLMKTVPVIRCEFCPFERAGETAMAEVTAHEETRHAKALFERRFGAVKAAQPAPGSPAPSAPPPAPPTSAAANVPEGPSGFELPAKTATTDQTPGTRKKSDTGETKSTKPGGAGTAKTAT